MRLRNIPGADEAIAAHPLVIHSYENLAGSWQDIFGNTNPLHIEIGMGKGKFITTLAEQNPSVNYIGMERYSSVLLRALQRIEGKELPNLRFLCMDAKEIGTIFSEKELDRIYLNFSDPWPKDRHAKRRLTSTEFLGRFSPLLKDEGHLEFKTDNRALFDFSLEQMEPAGWELLAVTRDLHHDSLLNEGNVMTEYEEKFSSLGNPIYKLICKKKAPTPQINMQN